MLYIWNYLRHGVDEFPKDCVDTLIRWFTGDRNGLTIFNVAECILVLGAYLAGLLAKSKGPSAGEGDQVVVFGVGPVSREVVPMSTNASSLMALAEAVGADLKLPAEGLLSDALVSFVLKQLMESILEKLKDQEFLREMVEQLRKLLGL